MATMINTEELVTSVADDRLIKVIVGSDEEQQTFMLQDTLLRKTSRVFSANLNHEHLGDDDKGTLRFPEDDIAAWKVLVFWTFNHKLPEEDLDTLGDTKLQVLLVQCWILGDKYDIVAFQDVVMLELLVVLNTKYMAPSTVFEAVRNTPAGCQLRLLAAREVVTCISVGKMQIDLFGDAMTVYGFGAEVIHEFQARGASVKQVGFTNIGGKSGSKRTKVWEKFVIGSPPYKHWIHNSKNDVPGE